jgi:hypothetical protein
MTVKTQVKVFCVVMPCNVSVGYHGIGGPCSLHLHGDLNDTVKRGIFIGMECKSLVANSKQVGQSGSQ